MEQIELEVLFGWNDNTQTYGGITIQNCYNNGNVTGTGDYVGGISGYDYSGRNITNCYNAGKVSGTKYVGGILGYNENINNGTSKSSKDTRFKYIKNCYNTGEIIGTGDCVGGIAGHVYNTSSAIIGTTENYIQNCYNAGKVSGSRYVGGICGEAYSRHSNTTSTKTAYVTINNANILNCYNNGSVTGTSNYVGGICGYAHAVNGNSGSTKLGRNPVKININYCYNTTTEISGSSSVGRIYGYKTSNSTGITVSTSNSSDLSGTEVTIASMIETLGTAFREKLELSTEYPVLSWQTNNDKLDLINGDNAFVEDTQGINGGYPLLAWQEK